MKACRRVLAVAFVSIVFASFIAAPAAAVAQSLAVDGVHSSVLFRIKHLNTSYSWGRFDNISGNVNLAGKTPSVEVQIKADSVDTANEKRDQHLKGPDFFNVKQFPTISFKSTRVTRLAENKWDLEGLLSVHGVERPLKVQLEQTGAGKNQVGAPIQGFETSFLVKRSDFGMKFLLDAIGDEVLLIVALECSGK